MAFDKLIKRDSEILNRMAKHNTQVTLGITDERYEQDWYESESDKTYQEYLVECLEECRKFLPALRIHRLSNSLSRKEYDGQRAYRNTP